MIIDFWIGMINSLMIFFIDNFFVIFDDLLDSVDIFHFILICLA